MKKTIKKEVIVKFKCDSILDHKAPLEECTKESQRKFNDLRSAENFMAECTEVLNLEEIYDVISVNQIHDKELNKSLFS